MQVKVSIETEPYTDESRNAPEMFRTIGLATCTTFLIASDGDGWAVAVFEVPDSRLDAFCALVEWCPEIQAEVMI